jgi:hypothetical protein
MEKHSDYYIYLIYHPNGTPCYVGKGRSHRWKQHAKASSNQRLARIYAKYGDLPIVKVKENLTNEEAMREEVLLIASIGRENKGMGPLVNFTDGGEGASGIVRSAETRAKLSASNKGRKNSPESIEKTASANRGVPRSKETRTRISAAQKGKVREMTPAKIAANTARRGLPNPKRAELNRLTKGVPKTPEHAEKLREVLVRTAEVRRIAISKALKGRPKTPEEIAAKPILQKGVPKSEAQKAKMAAARIGRKLTPEHKAAIGAAHVGRKRSPEAREAMRLAQRTRYGGGELCTKGHAPNWHYETTKYGQSRKCRTCKNERQRKPPPPGSPSLFPNP